MDTKKLNSLDGDAMYQEVLAERIERNRKLYKAAIKNAVMINERDQKSANKANARADKNQKVLDDLVTGGMESFLVKNDAIGEYDGEYSMFAVRNPRPLKKFL